MNEEEQEIFNNLKEYMQQRIDKGYHKFIYNDLDWDFKCIDCINALNKAIELQKELDKKDKVIDLMAEFIGYNKPIKQPKEEIKEYFYKKVEEENE